LVVGSTLTVPKSASYSITDIYNGFMDREQNSELFQIIQGVYEYGQEKKEGEMGGGSDEVMK